jgi:hypothetical protein
MIDANKCFDNIRHLPHSKWPNRKWTNRLEPECWPVLAPKFKILPGSTVFSMGSCFARNIEDHLFKLGFVVPTLDFSVPKSEFPYRPNGILNKYTPPSIWFELKWASDIILNGTIREEDLINPLIQLSNDEWVDAQLAGFRVVSKERAVERRREVFYLYEKGFNADVVTITLGLLECWWDSQLKRYIQQIPSEEMLKAYPERFMFDFMDYEYALEYLRKSIELLNSIGTKGKKIILTTSPVPMARSFSGQDAIIANTYAKSILRAVAGVVARENDNVDYFPSYESVMLSRWAKAIWMDDLIHVNNGFVAKIVDYLIKNYMVLDKDAIQSI